MSEVTEWKQLKVKTMWNGEVIAYEEAKDGEFVLKSDFDQLQSENKQLREKLEKSLSLAISIKNKFSKHGFTCYEDCDLNTNYEDEEVDCTCGVSLSENDIHRYLDSQISTLKQLTKNGGEDANKTRK